MFLKSTLILLLVKILCVPNYSDAANILAIVPSPSYSHQIAFRPIWKELSARGHKITLITADPMKDESLKSIREIDIHNTYKVMERHNFSDLVKEYKVNMLKVINVFAQIIFDVNLAILENPVVKELIGNQNNSFDLLMVEFINPIVVPFTYRFKAPVIGMLSFDAHFLGHDCVGNPTHPVLYPDVNLGLSTNLSFLERVASTLFSLYMRYFLEGMTVNLDVMVKEYFGKEYPPILEQAKNIDMLFVNSNPVLNQIRPAVPATVLINGLHLKNSSTLPKDLKQYLDNSKTGVIYFSLGTNVKSSNMDEYLKQAILETFSELPYDVLWKFEDDELPKKPRNVKIMKWTPQQDILRHPNIKLFITQGGVQSLEEAVYSRVPMVGIPFLGEQESNVNMMVSKGLGLSIDHRTFEKNQFMEIILEVINNPRYRETINILADLVLDQPMTGIEKAVWWTEYILRHKGAKHLKGPSVDMPLYQYFLLDVMGFLVFILIFITFAVVKTCAKGIRYFKRKQKLQ